MKRLVKGQDFVKGVPCAGQGETLAEPRARSGRLPRETGSPFARDALCSPGIKERRRIMERVEVAGLKVAKVLHDFIGEAAGARP